MYMKFRVIRKNFKTIMILLLFVFVVIPLIMSFLPMNEGFDTLNMNPIMIAINKAKEEIDASVHSVAPAGMSKTDSMKLTQATMVAFDNAWKATVPPADQIDGNVNPQVSAGLVAGKSAVEVFKTAYKKSIDSGATNDTAIKEAVDATRIPYPDTSTQSPLISTPDNNLSKTEYSCDKIPCIADFGTEIGDDLCCGQTGTLKNTKYVCPANKRTCSNFKCGSKFGICQ